MKKLAVALLCASGLLCAACLGERNVEYYDPPEEFKPTPIVTASDMVIAPTEGPSESLEFSTPAASGDGPIASDDSPGFLQPGPAIAQGIKETYDGPGTEEVAMRGFKIRLGEEWERQPDDNAGGEVNTKIIDGPIRFKSSDNASLIVYVQDNAQGWDATDEQVNASVANTMMEADESYMLLDSSTIDTPLGPGLMIYYKLIDNEEEGVHNQRACLVMVPVDNKVLAISAGAYESNEASVFSKAFTTIGRALGSAEAEYI